MGHLSARLHRVCVPWQGLLLTASLLTFWNLPTSAQLTTESMPSNAAEGKEVLLLTYNVPQNTNGFNWYKGERVDSTVRIIGYVIASQLTTPGPAYSGREVIYSNASLLIRNVTLNDTGFYTLQVIKADLVNEEATVQFHVYPELSKPYINSSNSNPVEDEDVVALTCETEAQNTNYLWWVNNQSLPVSSRLLLSNDNRTLTLLNVTRNDTGPYECEIQNPVSVNRSDPVTLNVTYGPDTPTISPSKTSYYPGANLSLFCDAASNPPAEYSWLINGTSLQKNTQELFISNITVDDSGSYACVALNPVTGRNRTTVKTIIVSNMESSGLSGGAIAGIVIGVLAGVALIAGLVVYFQHSRKTGRASDQRDLTEHKLSDSNHTQDHSDNSPNKMKEVTYSSLNFTAQQPRQPTSASSSPTTTDIIYSEVKKK
uniref:Ig-like domain-containing protein n=1 Tax=Callithrix jacchus TaxID=9483 RepID=F7D4I0_CALJA